MSRETDSSSSGPQGRGAAAYPSGTPPYGTSAQGAASGDAGPTPPGDEGTADTPKTETTLTTRIRINIPGSRPIPPVVMRTPMSDVDGKPEDGADAGAPAPGPDPSAGQGSALAGYAAATTDTGAAPGPATGSAPAAPAEPKPQREEKTSDWFAPRKSAPTRGGGSPAAPGSGAPGSGAPGAGGPGAGGPAASGQSGVRGPMSAGSSPSGPGTGGTGGSGAFDVSGALASGPLGSGGAPQGDRGDLPYFAGNQSAGGNQGAGNQGPGRRGPAGPTTGPATGDGPMVPPSTPNPLVTPASGAQNPPRMSDDTAILTPQKPAPEPSGNGGNVSGDTLTSGIPVVPGAGQSGGPGSPFAPGGHPQAATPHAPPKLPDPVQTAPAAAPAKKKKKGRSKLVLLGAGVVGVAGVAYGAGLLMNHSDVPKGTTVLGVDIGGGTRDEAAAKLEDTLGKRTHQALKLSVEGKTVELKPDQSGLSLDSAATVSAAAGSDYNPVSVIGSLFGNQRVVDPVMPVDEEKLSAALEQAAGGAAASGDGTIRFVPGKAVAVYGKTGKGIDVARSTTAVEDAYKAQVETGTSRPVQVPTTTHKPTVPDAEVDRMMKEFAEPAMSGLVTIKAGPTASIPLGPDKSLPKILGVKAVDGKLVDTYDLAALKELYGSTFDGVLITRGNGKKTPVNEHDVAAALRQALKGKTAAQRTVTIDTNAG